MGAPRARPGAIVAFRERSGLGFGLVAGEEKKGRVPLLLARGRAERVNESRIVVEVAAPAADASGEQVAALESRALGQSQRVDVQALWEIVREDRAEDEEVVLPTEDLAELALGSALGIDHAALFLALLGDGVHFVRKGEEWAARPRNAVEGIRHEREKIARREREKEEFFAAVAAAGRGGEFRLSGSETEGRQLDALERLAVLEDTAPAAARQLALSALTASGLSWQRPHEGAFELLRRLGRFTDANVNLQPLRFGLRTSFPDSVLEQARAAAERDFDRSARRDLRNLTAISIDSPHTRDIDDLLSLERGTAGAWRLGVHIADPAAFVAPGDAVDDEALARGLTHYMPDLRLPMLPEAISERAASLLAGQERPALSFLIDLDVAGCVTGYEIVRSEVRSAARLSYDESDLAIASGAGPCAMLLRDLAEVGELREQMRTASGAVTIRAPEVDVRVLADGTPLLERLAADSPARRAVSESMIVAGEIAARYCMRAELPVIYRRQSISERLEVEGDPGNDPVLRRRLRRAMKRADSGLEPGPHDSLGLAAYAQVSSPLRRFQDLASHRQIIAHLEGRAPCYDRAAMQRIAASTEQAEADARRAEQAADDFWLLRYLERQGGQELAAVVVELAPRPVVQLVETLREQPLPGLHGVELGQAIRVRVAKVNPRAGLLVLNRVD